MRALIVASNDAFASQYESELRKRYGCSEFERAATLEEAHRLVARPAHGISYVCLGGMIGGSAEIERMAGYRRFRRAA